MVTLVPNAHVRGNSAQEYWLIFLIICLTFKTGFHELMECVDNFLDWINAHMT